MKRLLAVLVIGLIGAAVWAQDVPADTPVFVRNLVRLMSEAGWTSSDLAEFRQSCSSYQWEGLADTDPALLMRGLRYSFAYGDPLDAPAQAELAYELAVQVRSMLRLGYGERDIARLTTEAVRDVMIEREASGGQNSEVGDMVQASVRNAVQAGTRDLDRDRTRDSDPEGPALRYGEDQPPGEPPVAPGTRPVSGPAGTGGEQPGPGAPRT